MPKRYALFVLKEPHPRPLSKREKKPHPQPLSKREGSSMP